MQYLQVGKPAGTRAKPYALFGRSARPAEPCWFLQPCWARSSRRPKFAAGVAVDEAFVIERAWVMAQILLSCSFAVRCSHPISPHGFHDDEVHPRCICRLFGGVGIHAVRAEFDRGTFAKFLLEQPEAAFVPQIAPWFIARPFSLLS